MAQSIRDTIRGTINGTIPQNLSLFSPGCDAIALHNTPALSDGGRVTLFGTIQGFHSVDRPGGCSLGVGDLKL